MTQKLKSENSEDNTIWANNIRARHRKLFINLYGVLTQ
jgi:hypothetical protein